ncbi:hypothetical protein ABIE52_003700 [Rhodococcus sp. OAS809]|uniref:hypothetical protein n=1 Tax=Rhodococcus sp. OAS809 TaxID=2663874 RepID=UPI00178966D1
MVNQAEDLIRETFQKLGDTLGIQIDIPDEMIANLAATLQADIDRIEAVDTERFSFLNELGVAFRRGEKNARPSQLPVLEGIRAVLAHLQSAGRLIPAGGMALAVEQVEDVRAARETLRGYRNYERHHVNQLIAAVDALFPATEPAEAPCTICNVNETNHAGVSYYHPFTTELGPFDDDGNDRPAPAEPAEEVGHDGWLGADAYMTLRKAGISEEAAESAMCLLNEAGLVFRRRGARIVPTDWLPRAGTSPEPEEQCESMSIFKERCAKPLGHEGRHGRGDYAWGYPFTPAEPAEEETKAELPTEVGDRIRASVTRWSSALEWPDSNPYIGTLILSNDGFWEAENDRFVVVSSCFSYIEVLEVLPSPVVPAPNETGPWETWQEVPEGVKYWRSGWPNPTLAYWVNRGGVRFYADAAIHEPFPSDTSGDINLLAPFVAAEEG